MINVVWKTYQPDTIARGYWDQGLLEDLFDGKWPVPGFREFRHSESFDYVEPGDGAVVVVPARHNVDHVAKLNADIAGLPWVVLILTGDEESVFDWRAVVHPNMRKWVMSPTPGLHPHDASMQYLGSGYPPHARECLSGSFAMPRDLDVFFSGQDTHQRRHDCIEEITVQFPYAGTAYVNGTEGFTQGLEKCEYFRYMATTKLAPCPSGPVSVDSFRVYEALESGAIPIADAKTPSKDMREHWSMVFGENPPFPVVDDWSELRHVLALKDRWKSYANMVGSWWERKKRDLALRLTQDLDWVGAPAAGRGLREKVSVVMVTSPIHEHPNMDVFMETFNSIRSRLPDVEIFVLCDGVRMEQEHYRGQYEEYVNRLLWYARNEWRGVYPIVFDKHRHQANMVRDLFDMDLIKTPYLLFVEHDTPLDGEIPWEKCLGFMKSGKADVVRFHHEAVVPDEHWHLYPEGREPIKWMSTPFLRTIQWSQRPHLAGVEFYKGIIKDNFSPLSSTMIEDTMHGVAQDPSFGGRIYVYYPPGNCRRSGHLDGRGEDPKFEMTP